MSKLFRNSPDNVIPTKLGFFQCSLAWNEKFSLPFSAQGESLSQKKNEMEKAESIFRDTRIMHTFQEFVRGDASLLVRLPRCSFHSLLRSKKADRSSQFWIRNQNGQLLSIGKFEQGSISLERCKLELDKMEQKSSFIVTFARWKDPIFSRITIIVRTMLTTAVLADLIFHPRNARNCFLPLYRIYVILLQLTKNTDSPPLF